jgi:uncharacterized oxidoreductase
MQTPRRYPPFDWNGQRVLLTGGAGGVGQALAAVLADRGARVVIAGRDAARLARVAEPFGGRVVPLVADLADPDAAASLVERSARALGGLSVLVANAAIQQELDVLALAPAALVAAARAEFAVNLDAPLALCAHALPVLRRAADATGTAAIVTVTSGLALVPKRSAPVYCASKAALRSLTLTLRDQLAVGAPAVRVHEAILPLVDTPMTAGRGRRKLPPGRVAEAIADGVAAGRPELRIGAVKLLALLLRISPTTAARLLRAS